MYGVLWANAIAFSRSAKSPYIVEPLPDMAAYTAPPASNCSLISLRRGCDANTDFSKSFFTLPIHSSTGAFSRSASERSGTAGFTPAYASRVDTPSSGLMSTNV